MKQIERKMLLALKNGREMSCNNTSVCAAEGVSCVFLFGVLIAIYDGKKLEITNCGGWRSVTTFSRLRALLSGLGVDVYPFRRDWVCYWSDGLEFGPREFVVK